MTYIWCTYLYFKLLCKLIPGQHLAFFKHRLLGTISDQNNNFLKFVRNINKIQNSTLQSNGLLSPA